MSPNACRACRSETLQFDFTMAFQPIVDIKVATGLLGTTPNTATALINDLVELKVLKEITGQRRNRLFMFFEYMALFHTQVL